jgi:hypothetical protein
MRVLLSSLLLAAVIAGAASAARVGHRVATAGAWRAELTWVEHPGTYPPYTRLHLAVRDAGRLVLDRPVRIGRGVNAPGLQPGGLGFRDLDGDGRDELLVDLFTGGAHCCFVEQVVDFAARTPRVVQKDFGDPGARVETLGGRVVLRSANDAFAYRFTAYVASGLPVQIWAYHAGRFQDVTRSYPRQIARDARGWWRIYLRERRRHGDVRGVLAAWAADRALLGHAADARATVARLAPAAYVRALWRFLAHEGYLR